jgi:hypothetical protein
VAICYAVLSRNPTQSIRVKCNMQTSKAKS